MIDVAGKYFKLNTDIKTATKGDIVKGIELVTFNSELGAIVLVEHHLIGSIEIDIMDLDDVDLDQSFTKANGGNITLTDIIEYMNN